MAQEAQSQSLTLAGPFDDTGDIGHDKRLAVAVGHDAEVGFEGSKRIIGNLRLGS